MSHAPGRAFWFLAAVLLLLTRIPAAAEYLSIDNVNLALALENFDPRIHQPQPPGYPFFVAFARVVNLLFGDAERTFLWISVLVTALCLPVTAALGTRMFGVWAGQAAVLLLLLNPVFWQTGVDGPLRPNLALFMLLTAYCSWRAWNGEQTYVLWGALAAGAGSGFRPDLLVFTLPLWFVSALKGTRSFRWILAGGAALAGVVLVWTASLAVAVGGPAELYRLTTEYLVDQSRSESIVMGAAESGWMRQISRLVVWNGIALAGWAWALPILVRERDRLKSWVPQAAFLAVWLVPGLIFQALIHVAAPGHTLFSVPAWCLAGGFVLHATLGRPAAPGGGSRPADLALIFAAAFNVMVFLNYFGPPAAAPSRGLLDSARNAVAFAVFETSLEQVRWLDNISRVTLRELEQFRAGDRPVVLVTNDVHVKDWFMNWRILRYYAPDLDIWVTAEQRNPSTALLVRRDKTIEARTGEVIEIPVPRGGRVIWLLERGNAFHAELARVQTLHSGQALLYSDIPEDAARFRVSRFEFVPVGGASSQVMQHGIQ